MKWTLSYTHRSRRGSARSANGLKQLVAGRKLTLEESLFCLRELNEDKKSCRGNTSKNLTMTDPALICGGVVAGFVIGMFLVSVLRTVHYLHNSKESLSSKVVAPFEEMIAAAGTAERQHEPKETIELEDIEDG